MSDQKDASGKESKTPPKVKGTKRPISPNTLPTVRKQKTMKQQASHLIREIVKKSDTTDMSTHVDRVLDLMDQSPLVTYEDLFNAANRLRDHEDSATMTKVLTASKIEGEKRQQEHIHAAETRQHQHNISEQALNRAHERDLGKQEHATVVADEMAKIADLTAQNTTTREAYVAKGKSFLEQDKQERETASKINQTNLESQNAVLVATEKSRLEKELAMLKQMHEQTMATQKKQHEEATAAAVAQHAQDQATTKAKNAQDEATRKAEYAQDAEERKERAAEETTARALKIKRAEQSNERARAETARRKQERADKRSAKEAETERKRVATESSKARLREDLSKVRERKRADVLKTHEETRADELKAEKERREDETKAEKERREDETKTEKEKREDHLDTRQHLRTVDKQHAAEEMKAGPPPPPQEDKESRNIRLRIERERVKQKGTAVERREAGVKSHTTLAKEAITGGLKDVIKSTVSQGLRMFNKTPGKGGEAKDVQFFNRSSGGGGGDAPDPLEGVALGKPDFNRAKRPKGARPYRGKDKRRPPVNRPRRARDPEPQAGPSSSMKDNPDLADDNENVRARIHNGPPDGVNDFPDLPDNVAAWNDGDADYLNVDAEPEIDPVEMINEGVHYGNRIAEALPENLKYGVGVVSAGGLAGIAHRAYNWATGPKQPGPNVQMKPAPRPHENLLPKRKKAKLNNEENDEDTEMTGGSDGSGRGQSAGGRSKHTKQAPDRTGYLTTQPWNMPQGNLTQSGYLPDGALQAKPKPPEPTPPDPTPDDPMVPKQDPLKKGEVWPPVVLPANTDRATDALRPRYGLVGPRDVIPSPMDQLRSDIAFDMFSFVQPGFGEGSDNKLFKYQQQTENGIQGMGRSFLPRQDDGRLNYQHPMPFQWQCVQDITKSARLLQREEDLIPLVNVLVRKLGEASTGVLGRDVPETPVAVSSSGLRRDPRSVFEPVIQNADNMQPTLDPAGYLLHKRGWRRDFSPWREPQMREIQPPMNRGPHLNKRRSLEVILP